MMKKGCESWRDGIKLIEQYLELQDNLNKRSGISFLYGLAFHAWVKRVTDSLSEQVVGQYGDQNSQAGKE